MEIINTGKLERLKWENSEDVQAIKLFSGVYGVGAYLFSLSNLLKVSGKKTHGAATWCRPDHRAYVVSQRM